MEYGIRWFEDHEVYDRLRTARIPDAALHAGEYVLMLAVGSPRRNPYLFGEMDARILNSKVQSSGAQVEFEVASPEPDETLITEESQVFQDGYWHPVNNRRGQGWSVGGNRDLRVSEAYFILGNQLGKPYREIDSRAHEGRHYAPVISPAQRLREHVRRHLSPSP